MPFSLVLPSNGGRSPKNGPGYPAHAFEDYLQMLAIWHIRCSPHHPQTNGKLERFHETLKARVNLLVYSSPEELRRAIGIEVTAVAAAAGVKTLSTEISSEALRE